MLQDIADALNVSPDIVVVLSIVVLVQLALQIYSLIDLARREHVTWGKKWPWLLSILFVSSGVGAILYLAVGRQSPPAVEPESVPLNDAATNYRAQAAVDLLYGEPEERTRR